MKHAYINAATYLSFFNKAWDLKDNYVPHFDQLLESFAHLCAESDYTPGKIAQFILKINFHLT